MVFTDDSGSLCRTPPNVGADRLPTKGQRLIWHAAYAAGYGGRCGRGIVWVKFYNGTNGLGMASPGTNLWSFIGPAAPLGTNTLTAMAHG